MRRSQEDPLDNMKKNDNNLSIFEFAEEEVHFLSQSQNYCICFVDMVNSTKVTSGIIEYQKIRQYYSIFINTMAVVVKSYGAKIVKNAGDALIFYFPETFDSGNESAFKNAFECLTTIVLARDIINAKLSSENLPSVSYRISADYGRAEVATSTSSKTEDLFGSTVNICAKINSMAKPYQIVIGGDLHQVVRSFSFADRYHFKELQEGYSVGLSRRYPVYYAFINNMSQMSIDQVNQLFRSSGPSSIKEATKLGQQSQQQLFEQNESKKELQEKHPANILIVDDEPDTLFTYKSILSTEGYNVQAFTDPQEALKHFVQLPDPSTYYKLVILDIRMPGLNGLQLFYRIRAISPSIGIIFCSALDIAEELITILPGITRDHLFKKPMAKENFTKKINSILYTDNNAHYDISSS
ncbi:MAG: response regulator [Thermoproteota archaeon]|nr:response regulator [Thermoproteota archaeon]